MRIHGVTAGFVRELKDLGYKDLRVDEVVKLRIHAASPTFIREMGDLGYKNLALNDVVRMRIHGVTAQYVKNCATSATTTCRSTISCGCASTA